ncbi:MAG TPA: sugar porter family MFS transporter [Rhizomicrobium sp.]|nr:sugar porter family MFS transporter [Rhizomicrobium sp.]
MAKANYALVTALTLSATLGGLLFGYDTAVISGAVNAIDVNFIDPRGLSEGARNWLSGFTIGCALLGCVMGAALAGPLSTGIGRKGGLFVAALLFFVSSLGSAFPEVLWSAFGARGADALWPFIGYRLLGGVAIGMASMLAPMYIAEIAPAKSRGLFVTMQQIAIVGGINLVYYVNYLIQARGDHAWLMSTGWRYMLASAALPAALLLVCMLLVPDTPRYLVMKGRIAEALKLLQRLGGDDPAKTLKEIEGTLVVRNERIMKFGGLVLFVGIMLSVFQQFVGINAVLYYAPLMFENMGASTDSAFLQAVIVGAANTVFTLIAFFTVDILGRKPLLVIGALIMGAAMITLGVLFDRHAVGLWAVVAVVVYIAGFALSWGPVVWVLLAEIFPNSIKGKAMSLAVAAQWISNFLVTQTFKVLDGSTALNAMFNHGLAYFLYGGASILAALFVIRYVPETKGHSLEAIQLLWQNGRSAWAKKTTP